MESLLFSKLNSDVSEADDHNQASFVYGKNIHNVACVAIDFICSHNF
jgi:hypothetical protein